jgi:hypothetical protein
MPGDVHVSSRPRGAHAPTADEIRAVATAFQGAARFLVACELRDLDVTWWERSTRDIVSKMREHARIAAMTDDEIVATLTPETRRTGGLYGGAMDNRDVTQYVARTRLTCGWILHLGGLSVGWERIEMESLRMDKCVQRARQQVRAFVAVAEMAVDMAFVAARDGSDADDTAVGSV